jgi:hypothetical protein
MLSQYKQISLETYHGDKVLLSQSPKPHITPSQRQCYSHTHWATYYPRPLRDTVLFPHPLRPHITHSLTETQCYSNNHWGHILHTPSQRKCYSNTHWGHIIHDLSETQCYSHTHWRHILLTSPQIHSVTLTLTEATYYPCHLRDSVTLTLRGHILLMPSQRHSVTLTLTETTYYTLPHRGTVIL